MDYNSDSDGASSVVFDPRRGLLDRPPRVSQKWAAVALIAVTILERIAFYSVTSNLVYTLSVWYRTKSANSSLECEGDTHSNLGMDSFKVINILIGFYLMCAVFCMLGGWLGDIRLGRYKTILLSLIAYIGGTIAMFSLIFVCVCRENVQLWEKLPCCKAVPKGFVNDNQNVYEFFQKALLGISFILLALAFGLYKPNIAPFGADQLRDSGNTTVQKFYNWFYFCSNLGSIIALIGVAYLQRPYAYASNKQTAEYARYLQYYQISYAIPILCIILALTIFCLGSKHYKHKPCSPDTLKTFVMICKDVFMLRFKFAVDKTTLEQVGGSRLELTKQQHGGDFSTEEVESVRDVVRIIPICLTFLLYWTAYSQSSSTYFIQGIYLDRPNWLPLSFVQGVNPLVIMLLVPLLDLVIYPALRERNMRPTPFTKIIMGYTTMVLSLCCAAVLGTLTRTYVSPEWNPESMHYSNGSTTYMTHISIFWTAPQNILIAISEILAVIAGMEFAYMEAPQAMKSFVMGLFFLINALGDITAIGAIAVVRYISISLSSVSQGWICNNFNQGRIDYFFLLIGGLLTLNTFWLMYYVTFKFQSRRYLNPLAGWRWLNFCCRR